MPGKPNTCVDCGEPIDRRATRCKPCAMRRRFADARAALPLPNPSGKCWCGCGSTTPIAEATRLKRGYVRGEHTRWVLGHQSRKEPRLDVGGALWAVEDRGFASPCWIWQGERNGNGYGRARAGNRKKAPAHRLVYEQLRGPIPEGLVIDHLCRQPSCVNPDHLEPVTIGENTLRGNHPKMVAYRNGTCVAGHPRTPENSYVRADGRRICRICVKADHERRRKPPAA